MVKIEKLKNHIKYKIVDNGKLFKTKLHKYKIINLIRKKKRI